jgi:hypothetical protein
MEAFGCSWVKVGAAEAAETRSEKTDAATAKETAQMKKEKEKASKVKNMKKAAMRARKIRVQVGMKGGVTVGDSVTFGDGSVARKGDLVLVSRGGYSMTAVLGERQNGNTWRCCVF